MALAIASFVTTPAREMPRCAVAPLARRMSQVSTLVAYGDFLSDLAVQATLPAVTALARLVDGQPQDLSFGTFTVCRED